jgi:hypothetical protein
MAPKAIPITFPRSMSLGYRWAKIPIPIGGAEMWGESQGCQLPTFEAYRTGF